jgi:hypothetical protein
MRAFTSGILLALSAVVAACAPAMHNAKMVNTTRCKEAPNQAQQPIPLEQSVEYLHSAHHGAYHDCVEQSASVRPCGLRMLIP